MMSGQAHASVAGPAEAAGESGGGLIIADDLPDGLVVADHAGCVTVFNRAAGRLTGIPPAHAVGQDVRRILPLQDAEGRNWWAFARPYHGLSTRTRHPERSLFLPCGTELLVTVGYVRDPRREARGGWHCDPGAVRRVVINIRGAQQRARIERSRADLVSTVAHELRSRLITELLDVSRIESGRIEVHRQLVDVPERASRIIAGRVAAGDSPSRFRLEIRGELPETWLDADKVDQVLGNLIENAVRHGAGTVTTMVEPLHTAGSPGIAVSVRDQGEGIAPELAPRVFRQFWRAKRRGGAGLGLFIVKGLVEAHGGTIAVHQAPGGGAEFRFTMPASPPDFG